MSERSGFHLAGGILAANASEIADALARLSHIKIRLTDEVEVRGDTYDLDIYPSKPGEYLLGGSLQLSHDASRAFVREIAKALEEGGLVYELELSPEEGGSDETFTHPEFWTRPRRPPASSAESVGTVTLGERLHSGTADEVRRGTRNSEAVLVTLTGKHSVPYDKLRDQLAFTFDGIAPLLYCGPSDPGAPYADMMLERLPSARPVSERASLAERETARLGATVADVVASVHAAGGRVDGIRPELVYIDDAGAFTALVPRGPAFIAASPIARGMRSYRVPYMAPEQLFANTATAASDVFSLCATLWFAATASHPFGDPQQISAMAARLLAGTRNPWPGSRQLGDLLARGLSVEPTARPTMPELAAALARLDA